MDSFMHEHQSALDSQREDDAIQYLQDTGVYPDPDIEEDEENFPAEDDEPTEFSDGSYRVHYDCLTEEEKSTMELNNS